MNAHCHDHLNDEIERLFAQIKELERIYQQLSRQAQAQIEQMTHHDALVKLPSSFLQQSFHQIERMDMENLLKKAIDQNEFVLHYQPKLNIQTGQIDGAEALIRWRRENHLLFPDSFIPNAEETGLIIQIGEWVIREACRQCKEWHEAGLHHLSVSVNLSPIQFEQQDLEEVIIDALAQTGLSPGSLELELTEGMVMKQPDNAALVLKKLQDLGIKISIDDFGKGFSSLSYLNVFPINTLKIDKFFIRNLEKDHANAAITSAVISLAHHLHLQVVAEGVETEEQFHFLSDHSCDFAQGYLISKPVEPHAITTLPHKFNRS